MKAPASYRRLLRRVLRRLEEQYGPRDWTSQGPAVDVLVGTILSQSTSRVNSRAGYARLREAFDCWDDVADAPVSEIEHCIRPSGLARLKAPRIRAILRRIRAERGEISLEFLREWKASDARDYLCGFEGVGPKTAWCVLLFSFGSPVFPVDTHIHRIAIRLGVLDSGVSAEAAHERLTPLIASKDRYAMHLLLIAHGRAVCRARNPRCEDCRLLELCPHGCERMGR